jgi:hypothetical protein
VPYSRISWNQLIRELQEWQQLQIALMAHMNKKIELPNVFY